MANKRAKEGNKEAGGSKVIFFVYTLESCSRAGVASDGTPGYFWCS